jgi:phosphate transport system protein
MSDKAHTVKAYDQEFVVLDQHIERMGQLASRLLETAVRVLERRDAERARAAIDSDREIDALERMIDDEALSLIARRQPVAVDLRHVATAMKVSGDIERIGDLAKNIAKRALAIGTDSRPAELMTGLHQIVELAQGQLKDVLSAYGERNAGKAEDVWRRDARIDAQYSALFRALLTHMMEDPRNIGLCTHLLFVAKNVERIGDHTTNIAEKVYFLVEGKDLPEERPKSDETPNPAEAAAM